MMAGPQSADRWASPCRIPARKASTNPVIGFSASHFPRSGRKVLRSKKMGVSNIQNVRI